MIKVISMIAILTGSAAFAGNTDIGSAGVLSQNAACTALNDKELNFAPFKVLNGTPGSRREVLKYKDFSFSYEQGKNKWLITVEKNGNLVAQSVQNVAAINGDGYQSLTVPEASGHLETVPTIEIQCDPETNY